MGKTKLPSLNVGRPSKGVDSSDVVAASLLKVFSRRPSASSKTSALSPLNVTEPCVTLSCGPSSPGQTSLPTSSSRPPSPAAQVLAEMPQSDPPQPTSVPSVPTDSRPHSPSSQPAKPWSDLFKHNRSSSEATQLEYFPDCATACTLDPSHIDSIPDSWGATLIGHVGGRFPGRQAILECCKSWSTKCQFNIHVSGWLLFRFPDEHSMLQVLDEGPYFIYNRPLLLKVLPPFFRFDNTELCHVPVWVQLPSLPLECWNTRSLGRILSSVGKPIRTDQLTTSHGRFSYARALVEVDVTKALTREVLVTLPHGESFMQSVIYEFVPHFCTKCRAIGHREQSCKFSSAQSAQPAPSGAPSAVPSQGPVPVAQPLASPAAPSADCSRPSCSSAPQPTSNAAIQPLVVPSRLISDSAQVDDQQSVHPTSVIHPSDSGPSSPVFQTVGKRVLPQTIPSTDPAPSEPDHLAPVKGKGKAVSSKTTALKLTRKSKTVKTGGSRPPDRS